MNDFDGIADIIKDLSEDPSGDPALWSVSSERGSVAERLHLQIMMGSTQYANGKSLNSALKTRLTSK